MSAALLCVWQSVSLMWQTRPVHVAQVSITLLTAYIFDVINKASSQLSITLLTACIFDVINNSSCSTRQYHTSHRLYLWCHKQGQLTWHKYLSHFSLPTFFCPSLVKGEPANKSLCCCKADRTTVWRLQSEMLTQFLRFQACLHLCLGSPLTSRQSCQVLTNSWENWGNRRRRDFCPTAHPPKKTHS